MKKNVKNRKPNSRLKSKRYSKKKVKQPQILGIGPKIINSILIGLNEGDFIHVRKIVLSSGGACKKSIREKGRNNKSVDRK